jgi:hypothetical protein
MASLGNYYINASILDYASGVFTDAALTNLASDGFYSNGLIVREQYLGVLMPQQGASSCVDANLNYSLNNNVSSSCAGSIFNMRIIIAQNPPSWNTIYLDQTVISNTTGLTTIPSGSTQIVFSFVYNNTSCTRMQSVIEINGTQVASQNFPILVGGQTYTLSYSSNITSSSSINCYVINY